MRAWKSHAFLGLDEADTNRQMEDLTSAERDIPTLSLQFRRIREGLRHGALWTAPPIAAKPLDQENWEDELHAESAIEGNGAEILRQLMPYFEASRRPERCIRLVDPYFGMGNDPAGVKEFFRACRELKPERLHLWVGVRGPKSIDNGLEMDPKARRTQLVALAARHGVAPRITVLVKKRRYFHDRLLVFGRTTTIDSPNGDGAAFVLGRGADTFDPKKHSVIGRVPFSAAVSFSRGIYDNCRLDCV